ncbi:NAD(P)/FAD-dependent oxidoreductase [Roseomonas hellenica]|uniref:NADH:ubiquinone reductase (non-electrogenic) n=1 Tax=Plastoroseomonas hellenica TaxID=2687306 RepID=A0ABS5ESH3_9PROT|nr:NAD(P)/FAD-dependent oxidoreductase [Plastoroseomonas hellenica]MBR0663261.1 NAD(P)/FAD-dependent oxidoreductase [Plastoroseomonas hellenica]
MPDQPLRPRVVILGAGFGGLSVARGLAREPVEVLVVDRRNHHLFQPLLYQVATAAVSPADVAWPVRQIVGRQPNTQVVMADATGIDLARRVVATSAGEIPYDTLVVACGVSHSYWGQDGWAAHAPGLKTIDDATHVRTRILTAFERAEVEEDVAARRRLLTFVVVGGGPTGVEMAGAVAEVARDALARDFKRIDPRSARIILAEAGPRILPVFPEPLSAYAQRALERMGVEVLTGRRVTAVDAGGVRLDEEEIAAEVIIWGAGVAAPALIRALPGDHDRSGRVLVAPDLSLPGHPEVFVVGDAAQVVDAKGVAVPGVAPAAKQMGRHVARVLAARLAGSTAPPPFAYRHAGDLATIGRNAAVVRIGRVSLTGFLAWLFWSLAHIYFLIGMRNRLLVATHWAWIYLTRQRGARLITGEDAPRS